MARHLALDWDYQQLRVVAATVRAGGLRLEQAVVWEEQQSPNLAEAEALGRHLRERLKSAGIAPAPVLACVGRDRVILREVRYPAVAAAEEAAIVRFQVLKELTDGPSEVIIDYMPQGEAVPGEERRALVLTVRRELLVAYQTLCRAAGVKLLALTPRPFGTLACLRESAKKWEGTGAFAEVHKNGSPHAAVAVLTAAESWSEFCLVHGDTLLVARSLPAGPSLSAEVRRNIAVYTAQSPRHVVSALYLAGNGETTDLQQSLQEALGIPVRSFDPFVGAEGVAVPRQNRGAFAGAVGLLRAQGDGRRLPINFVSPKQPQAARDPNKRRLALAGGIAAFLLIGVASYCYAQLAALDLQLENLQLNELTLIKETMPKIDEEDRRIKELSEWSRGNISWLDELYDLTALFPDLHAMQLFEFQGMLQGRPQGKDAAKDKSVAQMTLTVGTTNNLDALDGLLNQMGKDKGHYVPRPKEPTHDGTKEPAFPGRYKAQIDLEKRPPEKFNRDLKASSGDRRGSPGIRPAVDNGPPVFVASSGVAVNRNRVALPKRSDNVRIQPAAPAVPPNGAPGRAITPVKTPPVQPNAAPVEMHNVNDVMESFQAIMDAQRAGEVNKAETILEQARTAQKKARDAIPVAPTSDPASAPAPAVQKGEKK